MITPLLFYVYQVIPPTKKLDTIFGTIDSSYYNDIQILAWVVFGKLTPLLLFLIWFFTCKHWWYHVILVPVVVMSYQLVTSLNEDVRFLDFDDIYFFVPVVAIVAAFAYGIRMRIFDSIYGVDLDQELKRVKWNGKIVKVPANTHLDLEEVNEGELDDIEEYDEDNEPMWMA